MFEAPLMKDKILMNRMKIAYYSLVNYVQPNNTSALQNYELEYSTMLAYINNLFHFGANQMT